MNTIPTALLTAQKQLRACFAYGNSAGVAAIYAEEGQIMPAHTTAISGRAAIQAFWQGCIDTGIAALRRQPLEVDCLYEVDKATGTINETGEYAIFDRTGQVIDVGKYVLIWKRQAGEWQIYRDIWTSNLPSIG